MARFKKNFEEVLKKRLSTRSGGSLIAKKSYLSQDANQVNVYIGLGGLGGKMVNAMKHTAEQKMTPSDRRIYLAIDTCDGDMKSLAAVRTDDMEGLNDENVKRSGGSLAPDELFSLYDQPYFVRSLDHSIDSWCVRSKFEEVRVDKNGAQEIRQIGRIMLYGNGNSTRVESAIKNKLQQAFDKVRGTRAEVKIYIFAGIAGGTGSGTVVDASYMIRRIAESISSTQYRIEGFLFTPDVQENDDGMSDSKRLSLKKNFYAAFKEIDYFYNNKERNKRYSDPLGTTCAAYEMNIFDECTLVSRRSNFGEIFSNSGQVVENLANALVLEASGIEGEGVGNAVFRYNSWFSNIQGQIQAHGVLMREAGKGELFPAWAPTRYSSIGYGSFYVPRDEIIAYCANKLMERLIAQWNKGVAKPEDVTAFLKKYGLNSLEAFVGKLYDMAGVEEELIIDPKQKPKDLIGFLPVTHCVSYVDYLDELVMDYCAPQTVDSYIRKVFSGADRNIATEFIAPMQDDVKAMFLDGKKGPCYAIALLSAGISDYYNGRMTLGVRDSGVLVRLHDMLDKYASLVNLWKDELRRKRGQLVNLGEQYESKKSVDAVELDSFTQSCEEYARDMIKMSILARAKAYLQTLCDELNKLNSNYFEIYANTVSFIDKLLKEDSEYVTNPTRTRDGQVTIFNFDVADFVENDEKSRKFKNFFDGFINDKDLTEETTLFVNTVFKKLQQELEEGYRNNPDYKLDPESVVEVLREYFSKSFPLMTQDVIEKFCVIAYSDLDIDANTLTKIWDNPAQRDAVLTQTANDIASALTQKAKIMLRTADDSVNVDQDFAKFFTTILLEDTENLNRLIALPNKRSMATGWSEIIQFQRLIGFPAYLLDDLDEYAKVYYSEEFTGIHLDEVSGNWKRELPEPYGYLAATKLGKYDALDVDEVSARDKEIIENLIENAKKAQSFGLLTVVNQAEHYARLSFSIRGITVDTDMEAEFFEKFCKYFEENPEKLESATLMDVVRALDYIVERPMDIKWGFIHPAYDKIGNKDCTQIGSIDELGLFTILLRSNAEWGKALLAGVAICEKISAVFEQAKKVQEAKLLYEERITVLAKAFRYKLVDFVKDNKNGKEELLGFSVQYGTNADQKLMTEKFDMSYIDHCFILYHFFVDNLVKMPMELYKEFSAVLRDRSNDRDFEKSDLEEILAYVKNVLEDDEFLGNRSSYNQARNFREYLGDSKRAYDLPDTYVGLTEEEQVRTVIGNLKEFYTYLQDRLEKQTRM